MKQSFEGLQVSILASGSTGNITYVESAQTKLLIDCGLSGKKAEELLAQIDRKPEDLDAILVTHEHSDHIQGVGVLGRRYNLPIFANKKTWEVLPESKIGKLKNEQKFEFDNDTTKTIGDIDVSSFGVSHDAVDPQFYTFQKNDRRFVMLTDTGYVSDRMRGFLKDANCYLVESNHDIEMLRYGKYPWHIKQRILGDKGHLSNNDGALALSEMVSDKTTNVYLGHLSQNNNMVNIAHDTVKDILVEKDTGIGYDFFLYDTHPEKATDLHRV